MDYKNTIKAASVCLLSVIILNQFGSLIGHAEDLIPPNLSVNKDQSSKNEDKSQTQTTTDSNEETESYQSRSRPDTSFQSTTPESSITGLGKEVAKSGTKTTTDVKPTSTNSTEEGKWGTCDWSLDMSTGFLTIKSGTLGTSSESPWNSIHESFISRSTIKVIDFTGTVNAPANCDGLFSALEKLTTIYNLTDLKTTNVTNMSAMFRGDSSLTSLDLSSFDTSNVTNMSEMFYGNSSLTSLNVFNFDTRNVTNMSYMFYDTKSITALDLTEFKTSNVTTMEYFLAGASSLTSLDMSNFDTSNVTNMTAMFQGLSAITDLNLSNFDTINATNISYIFSGLTSLTSLDLSTFNTNKITTMYHMFSGINSLEALKLGGNFKFVGTDAGLGAPNVSGEENVYGNWIREDHSSKSYSPKDFMANYGTGDLTAGTYVAESLKWGTSPWIFDQDTGVLTIMPGTLGSYTESPWNRADEYKIDPAAIKKINFTGSTIAPADSDFLFDGLENLNTIQNLTNLNTSNVTSMAYMFHNDSSLTSLDLSIFDTSNVTNMYGMFHNDSSLTSLNVSNFDTSKVTSMDFMFYNIKSLTSLDLSHFKTSNVNTMDHFLAGASSLTSLDMSNFDTSNVTNMTAMFQGLSAITDLNLSNFDTINATNISYIFSGLTSLTSLDLSTFNTNKITTMYHMFSGTNSLEALKLGDNFKFVGTDAGLGAPKVSGEETGTGNWIREDQSSKSYSPTDFMANYGTGDLTAGTYVAESLKWGTSPWSFDQDTGVLTIMPGTLGSSNESPWNRADEYKIDPAAIKKINFTGSTFAPADSDFLFEALENLNTIQNLTNLNTSNVTSMAYMFHNDSSLISLDLSNFDTSNVTNMYGMFHNDSSLTSLNVSDFDTSKVTSMDYMFYNTKSLTNLDLSHFKTSNVTTMEHFLAGASSLTSLDISKFDTSNVMNMSAMFQGLNAITNLNLSNFDTSNATNISYMFSGLTSLTSLDLSTFNTNKITTMYHMFSGANSLEALKLGDNFKFVGTDAGLGAPKVSGEETGTGNWIREDQSSKSYSPTDFMANYGTGDLTAGTYVADITKKAELDLSVSTDKSQYFIGDKIKTTFSIRHGQKSEDESTAKSITLSDLSVFTLNGSQSLDKQLTVETYDATDRLVDSKNEDITALLRLPDLKKGNYYKVVVSGEAINNTDPSTDSNYSATLSYSPDGVVGNQKVSIYQSIDIESGVLEFSSVPSKLDFKTTPFSLDINGKLINRSDDTWGLVISDLRGTVAHGTDKQVDRQNWKVYATADTFQDENGTVVPNDALSTTFVKGSEQTDLSQDAVMIIDHDVTGEQPHFNSTSIVNWSKDEGLQAVVHDRSKLDSNKNYHSELTFELRIEP